MKFKLFIFFCLFLLLFFINISCSPETEPQHQIKIQNNYFEKIINFQITQKLDKENNQENEKVINIPELNQNQLTEFQTIKNGNYKINAETLSKLNLEGDFKINYSQPKKIKLLINNDGSTSFEIEN